MVNKNKGRRFSLPTEVLNNRAIWHFSTRMDKTDYCRKIDSLGRLVVPSKLRTELAIQEGQAFDFFKHQDEEGNLYLCIQIPQASQKEQIKQAIELLAKNGIDIVK